MFCVILFFFISQKREPTNPQQEATKSSPTEVKQQSTSTAQLPTLTELEKKYNNQFVQKGTFTIVTAFYKENPHVVLVNKEKEELELPISNVTEDELITFSLDNFETIHPHKHVGETIKLVQLKENKKYIEYR